VNATRAHLGLSPFDLAAAVPGLSPNPVAELSIANTGSPITVKLRVPGQPGQTTVLQGAPRAGRRLNGSDESRQRLRSRRLTRPGSLSHA
jgi:hypothetical protein